MAPNGEHHGSLHDDHISGAEGELRREACNLGELSVGEANPRGLAALHARGIPEHEDAIPAGRQR